MNDLPHPFGMTARQPPSNMQAEQALIGAIMANPKAIERVGFLSPDHFVDRIHGRIFAEQRRLIGAGGIADAVMLKSSFDEQGLLAEVGGTAYLAQLLGAMVGIINATEYGKAIHDAWKRRTLIDIGERIVNTAYAPDAGVADDIVATAVADLESSFADVDDRKAVSLDDAMDEALRAAEEARDRQGPAGLSTGFDGVDARLGGLEDGTMNVLAGRPGMGKTALGLQFAIAAARQGIGVAVVSLEMTARELGRRALCAIAGVPIAALKSGRLSVQQASNLVEARQTLAGLPLSIDDAGGLTMMAIDLKVRAAHRRHGVGLIVIDHLHIVKPEEADERNGATWAVGKVSWAMKAMAKRHRVPVLALAQLSRGVEGRDDKRPTLADLRQAGNIEQDADTVSFLYRAEYYLRGEPEQAENEQAEKYRARVDEWHNRKRDLAGKAELIVAKCRDGEPGIVNLLFHGETTSFQDTHQ